MKANIYSHENLIGTASLEVCDNSMGCICGEFFPTDLYRGEIQKYTLNIQKNNKLDQEKWNSFRINIQLENGYFIPGATGVLIEDFDESFETSKAIDIVRLNRHILEDYFINDQLDAFVEPPWHPISIGEKIAFEDEFFKEIGQKSKIPLLSRFVDSLHVLDGFDISALCKDQRNDDVLFMVRSNDSDMEFAIVHLTWIQKKEQQGYPLTKFYRDFYHFKNERMASDKLDYGED